MGKPSAVFEIIHESLKHKDTELSVTALCEIAGVSRSGYYRWVEAENVRKQREENDKADFALILEAFNYRGYKKGIRSIYMRLLHMGIVMNPKKIRRLMHKFNLFCPIATTRIQNVHALRLASGHGLKQLNNVRIL